MQKLTERQQAVFEYIRHSIVERGYPPTLREIGQHLGIRSTNGVNDHLRALQRKGYVTREDMKSRTLRLVTTPAPTAVKSGSSYVNHLASVNNLTTGNDLVTANDLVTVSDRTTVANLTLIKEAQRASNVTALNSRLPSHRDKTDDETDMVIVPIVGRVAAGALSEAIEDAHDTVRVDRVLLRGAQEVFGLRIVGESMIEAGIFDGDYVFVRKQLHANRGDIVVALVGEEATCKYYYPETEHVRLQPANSRMAPILIPKTEWRSTLVLGVVVGVYRMLG